MKYQFDGYNWLLRLERGELLVDTLTAFVQEENIAGAWVSGLGASQDTELGFYDLQNKTYIWKRFDQLMEITSLQGNVAWDSDKPIIHLHGTFSDQKMQAYGGHVRELQAGGTVEILLHRWYKDQLTRTEDPDTGLNLLAL